MDDIFEALLSLIIFDTDDGPTIETPRKPVNEVKMEVLKPIEVNNKPDVVQVYAHNDDVRAYLPDGTHLIKDGEEWHAACILYDTYIDKNDKVKVVKSYVGQPKVEAKYKETTVMHGTLENNRLCDIEYIDIKRQDEAHWFLDNKYEVQVTDSNVSSLVRCGYAISGQSAKRQYVLSAFVRKIDDVIDAVVLCDSRYEALKLLARLEPKEGRVKVLQLDEGDMAVS